MKALLPIDRTLDGSVTEVRALQAWNEELPMVTRPSGSMSDPRFIPRFIPRSPSGSVSAPGTVEAPGEVSEVIPPQEENALLPMVRTLDGSVTDVSAEQP
jgi:hypothetical protein